MADFAPLDAPVLVVDDIRLLPEPREVTDGDGHTQDGRILLDQHADAAAGRGARVLRQAARLDVRRDAGHRPRGAGRRARRRRPLRPRGPEHAAGDAAAHRRHGEGRQRRRRLREGDVARRQSEAGVRHHGSGPHGRLLRSQRRRVRRVGAEEDARHRRRQQPARRAELVRDDDDRRRPRDGVLLRAFRLDAGGDADAGVQRTRPSSTATPTSRA